MTPAGGFRGWQAAACVACLLVMGTVAARPVDAGTDPAEILRARYASFKADVAGRNQFQRPIHMDSNEGPEGVTGEIHALVDHPFAGAGAALREPSRWCDLLILHLNTKYCRPSSDSRGTLLNVSIGKKYDQPLEEAYRVVFAYRVAASTADYLQVRLDADEGPLGTRDYRVVLEAAPAEGGRTFIRLSYSYAYGTVARMAMQAYLGTIARSKVGFTVVGMEPDGQPRYIGGMRGVVERNTMRYYLALEAFLGALSAPPGVRVERSLLDWFAAAERYPRQLHEIEQGEYLVMKRREYSRQQPKS